MSSMKLNIKHSKLVLIFMFFTTLSIYAKAYAECRIDLDCSNVGFIWIGETTDMHYNDGEIQSVVYAIVVEINQEHLNIPCAMEKCPEDKMRIFAQQQVIYEEETTSRSAWGFAFTRPTAQEAFTVAKMICAPKVHPVVRR